MSNTITAADLVVTETPKRIVDLLTSATLALEAGCFGYVSSYAAAVTREIDAWIESEGCSAYTHDARQVVRALEAERAGWAA
tara:strand:+ start:798 stop:1043 length:246 start_codon:yes stop_codon:yes gene_type:complete